MITVTQISKIKDNAYDEIWAIVRSLKTKSDAITQVADLAPSQRLFSTYYNMRQNGKWDEQAFNNIYVPQFLLEMVYNKHGLELLNKLYQLDKAGKKIALVCFCQDETLCHRSIIAGMLQAVGCNVITDTGNDYRHFHELYKRLRENVKNKARKHAPVGFRGKRYFLSNMYKCKVTLNFGGVLLTFNSAEAAYHATRSPEYAYKFIGLDGIEAKRLKYKLPARPDWFDVNHKIMLDILRAKFTQNPELQEKLLATGNEQLVEYNTWNDTHWGVCNGIGENHLGRMLMQVRSEL